MELQYNFPKSGPFEPGGATDSALKLSEALEVLANQQAIQRTVIGAGLFKLDPASGFLTCWDPKTNPSINKAMKGAWGLNSSGCQDLTLLYCTQLLSASNILGYLNSKQNDLTNYNVIVHLHYYRNRVKPDQGFHKDTRGQTLFFMLHYLSKLPIYGAEWIRERGTLWKVGIDQSVIKNVVYNHRTSEHSFASGDTLPEDCEYVQRVSPSEVEVDSIWPPSVRQDIIREKNTEPDDDKIHVFRLDAYGAVLVVDDIVHHRTPNPKTRSEWGTKKKGYPQVSYVQAYNAAQTNGIYEIERGRTLSREPETERGRSRSRSMSNERVKKDSDQVTETRWKGTFDPRVRRFFRIWVTVSPNTRAVWY